LEPARAGDLGRLTDAARPATAAEWIELADVLRTFGQFPEADYCYRQGQALDPRQTDHLLYWGNVLDRLGRFPEALARYAEAEAAGGELAPYGRLLRGLVQLRIGNFTEAEQLLRRTDTLPVATVMLCRRLIRTSRAEEAIGLLDGLLRKFPNDLRANELRGWAEEELGRPNAAWPYEDRSRRGTVGNYGGLVVRGPRDDARHQEVGVDARLARARQRADQGSVDEAIQILRDARLHSAPEVYIQLANFQLPRDRQQAIRTMQTCLERLGPDVNALKALAAFHANFGEHEPARAAWLEAVDIRSDAELHRFLSRSYQATGDAELSARHAALERFEVGKEAYLKDNLQEAKAAFEAASGKLVTHVPSWFYLAETLRALGEPAAARLAYERCLRLNPDHGRALRGLSRLGAK